VLEVAVVVVVGMEVQPTQIQRQEQQTLVVAVVDLHMDLHQTVDRKVDQEL
jgi:hypothetical protein